MAAANGAVAPFVQSLVGMVNSEDFNCIHWSADGKKFAIDNVDDFCQQILPLFFCHKSMPSFTRQLNYHDFYKCMEDEDSGNTPQSDETRDGESIKKSTTRKRKRQKSQKLVYAHPFFLRDMPHLLTRIVRRTNRKAAAALLVQREAKHECLEREGNGSHNATRALKAARLRDVTEASNAQFAAAMANGHDRNGQLMHSQTHNSGFTSPLHQLNVMPKVGGVPTLSQEAWEKFMAGEHPQIVNASYVNGLAGANTLQTDFSFSSTSTRTGEPTMTRFPAGKQTIDTIQCSVPIGGNANVYATTTNPQITIATQPIEQHFVNQQANPSSNGLNSNHSAPLHGLSHLTTGSTSGNFIPSNHTIYTAQNTPQVVPFAHYGAGTGVQAGLTAVQMQMHLNQEQGKQYSDSAKSWSGQQQLTEKARASADIEAQLYRTEQQYRALLVQQSQHLQRSPRQIGHSEPFTDVRGRSDLHVRTNPFATNPNLHTNGDGEDQDDAQIPSLAQTQPHFFHQNRFNGTNTQQTQWGTTSESANPEFTAPAYMQNSFNTLNGADVSFPATPGLHLAVDNPSGGVSGQQPTRTVNRTHSNGTDFGFGDTELFRMASFSGSGAYGFAGSDHHHGHSTTELGIQGMPSFSSCVMRAPSLPDSLVGDDTNVRHLAETDVPTVSQSEQPQSHTNKTVSSLPFGSSMAIDSSVPVPLSDPMNQSELQPTPSSGNSDPASSIDVSKELPDSHTTVQIGTPGAHRTSRSNGFLASPPDLAPINLKSNRMLSFSELSTPGWTSPTAPSNSLDKFTNNGSDGLSGNHTGFPREASGSGDDIEVASVLRGMSWSNGADSGPQTTFDTRPSMPNITGSCANATSNN